MLLFLGFGILIVLGIGWFIQQPVFGSFPQKQERLDRMKRSKAYQNGVFNNLLPTPMRPENVGNIEFFRKIFGGRSATTRPQNSLPIVQQGIREIPTSGPLRVIWFGHSSYLLLIEGKRIWVDPVFTSPISPVSFFGAESFKGPDIFTPQDFPSGDLIIITHDHYDHLDYLTIKTWLNREKSGKPLRFLTALGVGETLERWGVPTENISELDWWEHTEIFEGVKFTSVPARHFSGRSYRRNISLWSGFVLETVNSRILIGGDSGYGPHFKEIGRRFGVFDLVFLECGQYSNLWPMIHMTPEEAVQAARDLQAKHLFPVHWGKFSLAFHSWDEPIRRVVDAAAQQKLPLITPRIGEMVTPGENREFEPWWEKVK